MALHYYTDNLHAAGLAPGTVRLYRYYLAMLADVVPKPWAATTQQLTTFLSCRTWEPETRKSARTAVRSFYRWAYINEHIAADPTLRLPPIRLPRGVPRPAPEAVVTGLVSIDCQRLQLMGMLAAYGGLRAGEISRVHSDDYSGERLHVMGKGRRERMVPIVQPALAARLGSLEGWAFPNRRGSHITPGHVTRLMSRAMPDTWTAHTLRHRLATRAYAGTADLLAVQTLLGHSRPETTQRYVLLPDDKVRAAVAAACA